MRLLFTLQAAAAVALTLLAARTGHAQQTDSTPAATPLAEDSVKAMSELVQRGVRQLRGIYFEPNDAKAVQLIDAALVDVPALNQRLSRYTASLPREQQQQLAQRLRQQPWQVELRTLLQSPQYTGFSARSAKNPTLKAAADRLQAAGFMGTTRSSSANTAPAPIPTTAAGSTAVPVAAAVAKGPAAIPATALPAVRHTVQKGETLFSIARCYSLTLAQLQARNRKATTSIRIGEVLLVSPAK